jgi:hypothetical protein
MVFSTQALRLELESAATAKSRAEKAASKAQNELADLQVCLLACLLAYLLTCLLAYLLACLLVFQV